MWIKSYLFERSEIVVVEGVKSEAYAMTSGVPQGSCIGPLLLAYVNDINNCLSFSHILKYADSIKIYKSFNLVEEKFSRIELQSDLNSLDTVIIVSLICVS